MYESKIYIVSKTNQFEPRLGMYWAEVLAVFNSGNVPELEDAKDRYTRTMYFIYDDSGEREVVEDMYDNPLIEIPIESLIRVLRRSMFNGNINRRVPALISALETFDQLYPNYELVCLHFGY